MEYLVYFKNYDLDLIFRKAEELGYCRWIRKACRNLDKNQYSKYCKTDKNIVLVGANQPVETLTEYYNL